MLRMVLNQRNNMEELLKQFIEIDTSDLPDFYNYNKPFERSLWVLWIVKEKLGIKRLSAEEIASIIRGVKEISVNERTITNSLNRAETKFMHIKRME